MRELKTYSLSEISSHTSRDDCWLIIHGKVLDVTSFLDDHPGGDDLLLQASVKGDATESFESVRHTSAAISLMNDLLIGTVDQGHEELKKPTQAPGNGASLSAMNEQPKKLLPSSSSSSISVFKSIFLPMLFLALAFAALFFSTFTNAND